MSNGYELAADYGWTADRLLAGGAVLLGLAGVLVAALALARASGRIGRGPGRGGGLLAVAAGLVAVVVGGTVTATADGGPGTGNGLVGAVFAILLGLAAAALGRLALTRSSSQPPARV